ncbi:hypothetical protein FRB95_008313 [Tulasnella sp. JGI-2019a]|nr:hypothetical protein FRB95_008313 [Tulasnella sp. JGI-2019a]
MLNNQTEVKGPGKDAYGDIRTTDEHSPSTKRNRCEQEDGDITVGTLDASDKTSPCDEDTPPLVGGQLKWHGLLTSFLTATIMLLLLCHLVWSILTAALSQLRLFWCQKKIAQAQTGGRANPSDEVHSNSVATNSESSLQGALRAGQDAFDQFLASENDEDLNGCIKSWKNVLGLCPMGHEIYPSILKNLGKLLQARFDRTRNMGDLEESICHQRAALCMWPMDHSIRPSSLDNLGYALRIRFSRLDDMGDLDEGIRHYQEAISIRPIGHADRPDFFDHLGVAFYTRFERTGDMADIEQSIRHHQEALTLRPIGHPNRVDSLNNLDIALRTRAERTGNMADDEQDTRHHQALTLRPIDHPNNALSSSTSPHSPSTVSLSWTDIILEFDDDDPEPRAHFLFNRALNLWERFEETGNRDDLDQSIECDQEALTLRPEGHPGRGASLSNLTISLRERFNQTGDRGDLDQSISHDQEILELQPEGHPDRAISLSKLANGLVARFNQTGDRNDLDQSISHDEEALRLRPEGHSDRAKSLSNLANGLRARFSQTGDRGDLDLGISHDQEALKLEPKGHPDRGMSLFNLAVGLWTRFNQTGDRDDLGLSIGYNQEALELRPDGHPDRAISLSNLAISLRTRFNQTGDRCDLDLSISHDQEALKHWPDGHPDRAKSLSNLAVGLQTRFDQTGDRSDLDLSINHDQEALSLRPEGNPDRAKSFSNLANGLRTRFEQSRDKRDLDLSINHDEEALKLRPEGNPDRAKSLFNLASGLRVRFEQTRDQSDLDLSISHGQEALKCWPEGHPHRGMSLSNLAIGLRTRFNLTGDRSDLDLSISHTEEAAKLYPNGHPDRAKALSNLAINLETRFEQTRDRSDLVSSLHLAREGAGHESSPVTDRLEASYVWVKIGRQIEDPSVIEAYTTLISLLDRHVTFGRGIGERNSRLRDGFPSFQTVDLASDAASYAIEHSLPETAIELLEQGRSILYSQLGSYRTSLVDLEEVDSELATRFKALSARLESSTTSSDSPQTLAKADEDVVARYQQTAADWARVVERIRRLPRFSSFLRGKTFQELQLAASYGPVVVVNISRFRSDAIVLQSTGPPLVIPLPDAPLDTVHSLSERMDEIAANPYKKPRDMVNILSKIWRIIVGPVAVQLEQTLRLRWGSRLCWMPTSRACSLPLHAAGLYTKGQRSMPDRFISSYTPTLSMLLRSVTLASPDSGRVTAPRLLLVSQAVAEGQEKLPGVLKEMEMIQTMFPQAVTLDGEGCTQKAVLGGLKNAEWVHFACHGNRNHVEPFESSFSLYNEQDPLTLLDIIKRGRPNAELAVLSACHSAGGDKHSPDEAIHMAAGMQFSGFKSVVGTIWASADEDGQIIAEVFYKHMFRNGVEAVDIRDSAAALREAVKVLRGRNVPFERWINYVHYGA